MNKKAVNFLKKHNAFFKKIKSKKQIRLFQKDMIKGLSGKKSSLKMIPTYIETSSEIPVNTPVIAIDAGGTNLRSALILFDNDKKAVIKNLTKNNMPGSREYADKEYFFKVITDEIKGIINESNRIGFCFSYPTEMFPDKDGRLIALSKEINVKNLIGEFIGKNFNKELEKKGNKSKRIIILNDTVSVLLSGFASGEKKKYSSYIGFILGTGTNLCYIEKNKNIKKVRNALKNDKQIINIEAGNFNKMPKSTFDKNLDKTSNDNGFQLFEKMVSGRYFGSLILEMLKTAVKENLFSEKSVLAIKQIDTLETSDINALLNNEKSKLDEIFCDMNKNEKVLMIELIESIIERNAKLAAIILSAVILKINRDEKLEFPVCIAAEGTTFYKLKILKEKTEKYLNKFLTEEKSIKYELVNIPDGALIGAAIAGLTN